MHQKRSGTAILWRKILCAFLVALMLCQFAAMPGVLATEQSSQSCSERNRLTLADLTPALPRTRKAKPEIRELDATTAEQLLSMLAPLPPTPKSAEAPVVRAPKISGTPSRNEVLGTARPIVDSQTKDALAVVRYSPQGEVSESRQVVVVFSQPMVPFTSQTEVMKYPVPIRITPEVPGQWRWLGTQTATFVPDAGRFPAASTFTVRVNNARSLNGAMLEHGCWWTFSTVRPEVQSIQVRQYPVYSPDGKRTGGFADANLLPRIRISFNQRVSPDSVLASSSLVSKNVSYPLKISSSDLDKEVGSGISEDEEQSVSRHSVVLVPVSKLPPHQTFQFRVAPGIKSEEGSRTSLTTKAEKFSTYPKFKIRNVTGADSCTEIAFNNDIDTDFDEDKLLTWQSAAPPATVSKARSSIIVSPYSLTRGKFKAKINPELRDIYGQTLASPHDISVELRRICSDFLNGDSRCVLRASDPGFFPIRSINMREFEVRVYKLDEPDFGRYLWTSKLPDKAQLVYQRLVKPKSPIDHSDVAGLDINQITKGGPANLLLVALGRTEEGRKSKFTSLINVTDMAIDAHRSFNGVLCSVSGLQNGLPVENVDVRMYSEKGQLLQTSRTSNDGTVVFPCAQCAETMYLVASKEGHNACIQLDDRFAHQLARYAWFATSDRGLYRPGETVYVKGWLTAVRPTPGKFPLLPPLQVKRVSWKFFDHDHAELATGEARVNRIGGFDFSAQIPTGCALGTGYFTLDAVDDEPVADNTEKLRVSIQEFVRPQFVFSLSSEKDTHVAEDIHKVKLKAAYYSGEPLPHAAVCWTVTATESSRSFAPMNRGDYFFGRHGDSNEYRYSEQLDLTADQSGESQLGITFKSPDHLPQDVDVRVVVTDINKRSWTSHTSFMVHPAKVCVGLRWKKAPAEGNPSQLEIITCDLDGRLVPNKNVRLRVTKSAESQSEQPAIVDDKTVAVATGTAVSDVRFDGAGRYNISASAADDESRVTETVLSCDLASSGSVYEYMTFEGQLLEETLFLSVAGENFAGTPRTVEIKVNSPLFPCAGKLIIATPALIRYQPVELKSKVTRLTVPVDDSFYPLTQFAIVLDPAPGKTAAVAYKERFARCEFKPTEAARRLMIHPHLKEPAIRPGQENSLGFKITDNSGNAMPECDVAVIVVDESLLSLAEHKYNDPLQAIFREFADCIGAVRFDSTRNGFFHYSQQDIESMVRGAVRRAGYSGGGGGSSSSAGGPGCGWDGAAGNLPPPSLSFPCVQTGEFRELYACSGLQTEIKSPVRNNFRPLAYFNGAVTTDSTGHGTVTFRVPDNLTKYRVILIAGSADGKFGNAETSFVVDAPFNIRQSPPRFGRIGDRLELPLVVQNNSDTPIDVSLAARTRGLKPFQSGIKTDIPAYDRVEVTLPVACETVGLATVEVVGVTRDSVDGVEFSFPVKESNTKESFAVDGIVDDRPVEQVLSSPKGASPGGSLTVTTSASAITKLETAHDYLQTYPFECSEQLASKILSMLCFEDLVANKQEGASKYSSVQINLAIRQLIDRQHGNGAFGVWSKEDQANRYVNAHVLHAFVRGMQHGIVIPPQVLENAFWQVASVKPPIAESDASDMQIFAYSQYVLNLASKANAASVVSCLKKGNRVATADLDVLAWCLPVVAKRKDSQSLRELIRRRLLNSLNETTGTASVQKDSSLNWQTFSSGTKTEALILAAIIADTPNSGIVPKLVSNLVDRRKQGRWANTQENVFAILALSEYFKAFENVPPDFVATLWLDDKAIDSTKFVGRGALPKQAILPVSELSSEKDRAVLIDKSGAGRLYYRMLLSYSLGDSVVQPMDRGFGIRRVYESVDDPKDVQRLDDGTWLIKRGAVVRVIVTSWTAGARHNVALVDPLPAGLEAINFKLKGDMPRESKRKVKIAQFLPVRHENLRDDRVEVVADTVEPGAFIYTYYARALTAGEFSAAPAYVEEMYRPETFGRTGSDRVRIVD